MRSPSGIHDDNQYWLRTRDVSDVPTIGGDGYFDAHDVLRAADLTEDDLPPTDSTAVREIDRGALEQELTVGKWQVTATAARIDDLWPHVVDDAESGILWAAKAMTGYGYEQLPYDDYVLTVYTPNYFDRDDVDRVRAHLRSEYGITHELCYKPDIYTKKGIVPGNAEEFGLTAPGRYVQ